jgi:hypothetical protein
MSKNTIEHNNMWLCTAGQDRMRMSLCFDFDRNKWHPSEELDISDRRVFGMLILVKLTKYTLLPIEMWLNTVQREYHSEHEMLQMRDISLLHCWLLDRE